MTWTQAQMDELLALARDIQARVARLEVRLGAGGAPVAAAPAQAAPAGGEVASDEDLASKYGDPQVRKDPTRWSGPSYAGCKYSQCPSDYLETLASLLDWQADQSEKKGEMLNNGKPRAPYLRRDAARARGWAKRNSPQQSPRGAGQHRTTKAADFRAAQRPAENLDAEPEI